MKVFVENAIYNPVIGGIYDTINKNERVHSEIYGHNMWYLVD